MRLPKVSIFAMFIVGFPFEGPSRRLARSGQMSEGHAAGPRGRRADQSAAPVRQWPTLSCCRRCYCCKTKSTDITKSGARSGIYCTMVLPIPWYLSVHHARRTNWLAMRSCEPNRREVADIRGSFRRPRTSRNCAFRKPGLLWRCASFRSPAKGGAHWRRGPPATDVPAPFMHLLNFTGRESATRTEAAKIDGLTLHIVRDRVLKFNAHGPAGLIDRKAPGQAPRLNDTHRAGPIPAIHGVVRWRIVDPMDLGGIPRRRRQAGVEPRTARHRRSQTFGSSSPSVLGWPGQPRLAHIPALA